MKKEIKVCYIEKLTSVGKEITIEAAGIKITEDSLLLANFIKKILSNRKSGEKSIQTFKTMLEIGAGQGIVSFLVSELENVDKIYAIEVQERIYELLKRNIEENMLEDKIIPVNKDIKDVEGEYSCIFSNPPYRKMESGKLPREEEEIISKYEKLLTLEELFKNIARLLENYGEFFIVIPDYRLNDCFKYIYANRLNVLSLNINKYRKSTLVVLHGKKGGKVNGGIQIY